jgi:hypothetical protein
MRVIANLIMRGFDVWKEQDHAKEISWAAGRRGWRGRVGLLWIDRARCTATQHRAAKIRLWR